MRAVQLENARAALEALLHLLEAKGLINTKEDADVSKTMDVERSRPGGNYDEVEIRTNLNLWRKEKPPDLCIFEAD